MGRVEARAQADASNPAGDEPGVLPRRHAPAAPSTAAREQELTRLPGCGFEVLVDCLAGLLRQLEPDRTSGLLLTHCRAGDGNTLGRNVVHHQPDHVAASELAIDR